MGLLYLYMCLYGTVTHMKLKNSMLLAVSLHVCFTDKCKLMIMSINPFLNQVKLDLYSLDIAGGM